MSTELAPSPLLVTENKAAIVEALEGMGFVTRSQDPTDGRRQIVDLTEAGWAQVAGQREAGVAWLEQALAEQVSQAELMTLAASTAILERILD